MAKSHYKALLGKVLLGFLTADDPVQAMLEWVAHQMMLIEAENKVGAEKGKHTKERKTYFSGVRVRRMDTRLGTIYLYIPKLRKGGYVPFFVTERKRSEMALATLVQEAFINGVSTRRIERLAQALGVENISASQVSEITKELEGQVESFRSRPFEEDSLQFYAFPEIDPKKISSTNMSKRTIREVRRRSRVVGIFPSIQSWVRLDTCYLMEYSEDWPTDRSYIKREKVQEALERGRAFLAAQAAS